MNNIRKFMIKYPILSFAMLLPVSLIIINGVMTILLEFILPILLAFWLSSIIYTVILGKSPIQTFFRPFWFIRY